MLLVFQNVIFHEILAPPMNFDVFLTPRLSRNDPKSTQEAPKRLFFSSSFSSSFLERFWTHFGSQNPPPLGTLFGAKIDQKNDQNFISEKDGPKSAPRRPQEAPKTPPGGPGPPPARPEMPRTTSGKSTRQDAPAWQRRWAWTQMK